MKYRVAALMLSVFLPTLAMAEKAKIDHLGYPFSAPADTFDSGDLDYKEVFANEIAEAILHPLQLSIKDSSAIKEFIENPKLRNYFIRELQIAKNLPDSVTKAFVTAVSVVNEETGENFIALFSPNPEKALQILSLQRNLLPEEAKVEYFKHPKMESGEYFTQDEKMHIGQYIHDNFKITQSETPPYSDAMGDFETN